MTPVSYHILLALVAKDRHGYLIRKAIEQQSSSSLRLGPGTLYAAIRRLEDEGLIEESRWRPEADLDDPRRRYYHLTSSGRAAVRAETARLRDTVSFALKQLNPKPAR